jgi:Rad3-related DNA helicase
VPPSAVSLQQLFVTCEALYQRDGFVRWIDVANTHGISRQAVQLRFKAAIERGELDQATYDRWQSMSARRTATAKRAKEKDRLESTLRVSVVLSPENVTWLKDQCTERGCTRADIINGLVNKARMGK